MNDKLIHLRDAAERLGKSENALRSMVHKRTAPPSAVVGGRRMFRESDLDAFIADAFGNDG